MNFRGRGVHLFILPFRYDDGPGIKPTKRTGRSKVVMKILTSVNILAYPLSRFPCM